MRDDLEIFLNRRGKVRVKEMEKRVCVTGAGGYLASWVVKYLLSKGYIIHGTVRDPNDEKYAHLKNLENALENLHLFKADLLDYDSLCASMAGCRGVLHIASPVPSGAVINPKVELLEPALTGTCNVLKACTEAKVKRVVVVSSVSAVIWNPNWPKDQSMDESCWSDKEYCRSSENWYSFSKTEAESAAWEYSKKNGLDVVTVCPSLIFGPLLQSTMNASSSVLVKLLRDGVEEIDNNERRIVDVRDVAEAVLLAYEKPEAEGRYLCSTYTVNTQELIEKLKTMYPDYSYPKKIAEVKELPQRSCEKLQKLGWKCITLEESLADSVKCYQEMGILD
ncbi:cinnamoyl-CoA reductase 2-like [Papaver somniferum]|uniref:cinnamoyl-CoA reductase 2-like n=1 Tax=Papaver somniferum TaxID=3469 RepID=UPI000E6FE371|nr:cinnamoyl-CoA reductase 2-like [Papaver somniferum]XP_026404190.1 cinnamoyl-CoA reductase 2-like [Papaver somniferum]